MNRFFRASSLIVLAAGSVGIYSFLSAQEPPSSIRESLQGTYIDQGYYSGGLTVNPQTTVTIGTPLAVTCPGKTTCTIQADMFVQTGAGKTSGNQFSVCLYVDGVRAPNCQDVGSTPADGTYLVSSTSQQVSGVAGGNYV